jgi:hypothetical protein
MRGDEPSLRVGSVSPDCPILVDGVEGRFFSYRLIAW